MNPYTKIPTANARELRGKQIAMMDNQIQRIDASHYEVRSQSRNAVYTVLSTELGWLCECPDHIYRHVQCKHIFAVEFSLSLRKQVERSVTISPISSLACPRCKSDRIVKKAIRHNKSGDIQRYLCKACGKRFSFNIGFEKMHATPQAITSAMQLYFSGESFRNVQQFLKLQGVNVDHSTVYRWIKKYVRLMESYLEQVKPQVSDTWRADELYVKIRGNMKYLFALMDDATRFWIAQEVTDRKEGADVTNLFRRGKEVTGTKPKMLITDGLRSYHDAFMKEYWTRKNPSKHVQEIKLSGIVHNNKMERLNGEVRDREKVMRGLKKTDTPIISGYQIYHNYVRPHESLKGQTPADLCGIKIVGRNKWLTLIQNASKIKTIR